MPDNLVHGSYDRFSCISVVRRKYIRLILLWKVYASLSAISTDCFKLVLHIFIKVCYRIDNLNMAFHIRHCFINSRLNFCAGFLACCFISLHRKRGIITFLSRGWPFLSGNIPHCLLVSLGFCNIFTLNKRYRPLFCLAAKKKLNVINRLFQ